MGGWVVGKCMGDKRRVCECEGRKFHAARKGGQRKKEGKKETLSPNKNKISGIYRIVTGR